MSSPLLAPRARELEPQERVGGGKYRLKRRIAVGGMGEVWVAQNEATAADVALKVLRHDTDRAMQAEARFRHEARLSAKLSHRSIIKIFDLVEEPDGRLVLVMELLRGETLHAFLERKGPRSAREAIAILSPILSALQHAHDLGIVHRDVSPANIYLAVDPDGQVTPKLVDFGIAKVASADASASGAYAPIDVSRPASLAPTSGVKTVEGRVLGTPRYMSPEQVRMRSDIDARSDLFSAAVVLYEIVTGASPFAASTAGASLEAVLDTQVDPDLRIEPRVWLEVQRALSKRSYERHGSAQELAIALRTAVNESEGSLAALLARTAPPRDREEGDDEPRSPMPEFQTKSIEGQSVALERPKRRTARAVWMAAGSGIVASAALVIIGWLATRGPQARPAAAAAPTPQVTTESAKPTATAPASLAPTVSVDSLPQATPPTTAAPPRPPVIKHPGTTTPASTKPKPIATTPGF